MSGHSKWKTIKHKKEATDSKRGKIFTKLAKIITIAAREGGEDPESNFKLRLTISKAKEVNMPKDNIQRAIDRGSGKSGESIVFKELLYEGFGPDNTFFIVEVTTDNTNRTVSELKSLFSKNGGNLAGSGAVSYLFDRTGFLFIEISEENNQEEKVLEIMEIEGVTDVEQDESGIEVFTDPDKLAEVRDKFIELSIPFKESELIYKPKSKVAISNKEKAEKLIKFIELIEDNDDVQEVYHNIDILDEAL